MEYRKDIQILRGIAVLLVVLFHLRYLSSGFLGVDMFFVISGYLMSLMYTPENKSEFLTRRARRLLPAYFATIAITVVSAAFVTVPSDYSQVIEQSLFALTFLPNVGYWLQESYFDKATFKPLLHLWSLGVEIQFYLIVPALYWLFNRWRAAFWILLAGSATLCFAIVEISPKTAFFWMPLRLWEFLLGFGIARYKGPSRPWIGALGLGIIIGCSLLVQVDTDSNSYITGHPGMVAAIICLATAATIAFRLPRHMENHGTVLEKIGGASYSIYLAHFPAIVLSAYQPFGGTRTEPTVLGYVLVFATSLLLFKLVEQPFRRTPIKWVPVGAIGVVIICLAGTSIPRLWTSPHEMLIYDAMLDRSPYRCGKLHRAINPLSEICVLTDVEQPVARVLLVGNSFADAIKSTFAREAEREAVEVLFPVANNPLMPGGLTPADLMRHNVDAIVLHFSASALDTRTASEVAHLARERGIRVALLLPVPTWQDSIPKLLSRGIIPRQSISDYERSHEELIASFQSIPGIDVYSTATSLCDPFCRVQADDGKPLYFDHGHLTLTGSEMLGGLFGEVISSVASRCAAESAGAHRCPHISTRRADPNSGSNLPR